MECNVKKAECIIHFSNYLMEQEDTARTNALSSATAHRWVSADGPSHGEAEVPSFPHHQQHITRPRRL